MKVSSIPRSHRCFKRARSSAFASIEPSFGLAASTIGMFALADYLSDMRKHLYVEFACLSCFTLVSLFFLRCTVKSSLDLKLWPPALKESSDISIIPIYCSSILVYIEDFEDARVAYPTEAGLIVRERHRASPLWIHR